MPAATLNLNLNLNPNPNLPRPENRITIEIKIKIKIKIRSGLHSSSCALPRSARPSAPGACIAPNAVLPCAYGNADH